MGLPVNAEQQIGEVMVDIAEFMHRRLDAAADLAEHPFHRDLRDWAARLGGAGAANLPARERLSLVGGADAG